FIFTLGQPELFQALPHGLPPIFEVIHPRHKIEIFLNAQIFPKAESLRHVADLAFDRFALVDNIVTETSAAPIICPQQSAEHAQKCGLAASVRPEKSEDLADAHVEIDVIDHGVIAEALRHCMNVNDGVAVFHLGSNSTSTG